MKYVVNFLAVLTLLIGSSAHAGIISVDFEAIVVGGSSLDGQVGTGTLTFSDDGTDASGNPIQDSNEDPLLDVSSGDWFIGMFGSGFADSQNLLSFEFTFLGQTFTGADDATSPDLPLVGLSDSSMFAVDFFVEDGISTDILNPAVADFQVVDGFLADPDDVNVNPSYEFFIYVTERVVGVSTPASASLLALGVIALLRRRFVIK